MQDNYYPCCSNLVCYCHLFLLNGFWLLTFTSLFIVFTLFHFYFLSDFEALLTRQASSHTKLDPLESEGFTKNLHQTDWIQKWHRRLDPWKIENWIHCVERVVGNIERDDGAGQKVRRELLAEARSSWNPSYWGSRECSCAALLAPVMYIYIYIFCIFLCIFLYFFICFMFFCIFLCIFCVFLYIFMYFFVFFYNIFMYFSYIFIYF